MKLTKESTYNFARSRNDGRNDLEGLRLKVHLPGQVEEDIVSTAMRTGRLWLAFIMQPHPFVPQFPAFGFRQFVTARAQFCPLDRPGRILLSSRLGKLHSLLYPTTGGCCQLLPQFKDKER